MNNEKLIKAFGKIIVDKGDNPLSKNLTRLSRNVTPNLNKIKQESIYFKIIFNPSHRILNETIALLIKEQKPYLKQQSLRISSFMFSNKNVSDLSQKFIQTTSLYCFIISSYINSKDYLNARNIFDSFFSDFNDIFQIFYNRIEKNYPNRGGTNTIKAFYPKMILETLKALSFLIHLSSTLNKQTYHSFFFNLYVKYLVIIKLKVDTFVIPRTENKQKENMFFIHSLSLCGYYFIWKITPLYTAVCLLNKITEIYNEVHDQEKSERELLHQYIVSYNLSLLYMVNDQSDNACTLLNRAIIICSLLNDFNVNNETKLAEINQKLIIVYLLLIEALLDKKEYYSALQCTKKAIPLLDKYNNATDEQRRTLDIFLKQINSSMQILNKKQVVKTDKIKEYKKLLFNPSEEPKSRLNFKFEVEEIEKLCLFLSSLSMHQIKLLNDTQPKMKQSISLPICFSNQFTDCLSFSQRMSLLNIKVLLLSRFIILKDPDKPITLQNLNYDLFSLREKPLITIKSKKTIVVKTKSPLRSIMKNKELEEFLALFDDKTFVNQNKELLRFCFKTLSKDFIKENMKDPKKMKELINLCKVEFKDQLDSERGFSTSRTRDSNDYYNKSLSMTDRKYFNRNEEKEDKEDEKEKEDEHEKMLYFSKEGDISIDDNSKDISNDNNDIIIQ